MCLKLWYNAPSIGGNIMPNLVKSVSLTEDDKAKAPNSDEKDKRSPKPRTRKSRKRQNND